MTNAWKLAAISMAIFGSVQLSACGGSECGDGTVDKDGTCVLKDTTPPTTCGEGTKLAEGACVLENEPVTCADGTTLTDGKCEPAETCGDGTTADATGKCVPDFEEVVCGTGTTKDGLNCIPDAAVCETGTTFAAGKCTPDVVCGDNTTARDGKCLTDTDLLKLDADETEAAGENDPTFGGTPVSLTLPAASASLTFKGTINAPADLDTDGDLDQDLDVFTFQAVAGTYLNVKMLNVGAGSTAFFIQGPNDYIRLSPSNQDAPSRQILLPYDGEYSVVVGPARQMANLSIGPVGSDESDYLLVVENLGPFDLTAATTLDAAASATANGNFTDLSDNAYKVTGAADQLVQVSLPTIGPDALASLLLFDDNGKIIGETGINDGNGTANKPGVADATTVIIDHVRVSGANDGYVVRATAPVAEVFPEALLGDKTVTLESSNIVEAGQSLYVELDVELMDDAGGALSQGVIVLVNGLPDGVSARAIGPDNKIVEGFGGLSGFHARLGGKYLIELTNQDKLRPAEVSGLNAQSYIPTDFGSVTSAAAQKLAMPDVPVGDFKFFVFETAGPLTIDYAATQTTVPEAGLVIAAIGSNLSVDDSIGNYAANVELTGVTYNEGGKHIGLIFSDPGDFFTPGADITGLELEIAVGDTPAQEVEPNANIATATTLPVDTTLGGVIAGGPQQDVDVYKVDATIARPTLLAATVAGAGLTVELRDETGQLYDANDGDSASVGAIVQPNHTYYVHVYKTDGFDDVPYNVSFTAEEPADATAEGEPNDMQMEATVIQPQLMPTFSFTAVGTLVGTADVDWFELTIPTDGYAKFSLENVAGLSASNPLISIEVYDVDLAGAATLTTIKDGDLASVTAGKKLIKVTGGLASGYGNSYQLLGSLVTAEDLGPQTLDSFVEQTGTFGADGEKLFAFSLANDVAAGESFAFWTDQAGLQILDANFVPIFEPTGGDTVAGAGYLTDTLVAGQYFARITGTDAEDWNISSGIYTNKNEAAAANDDELTAEDLGTLAATGEWTYIFGNVDDLDTADYFKFAVPDINSGAVVSVTVEHLQFGASLFDVDIYWQDLTATNIGDVADGWSAPQRFTEDVLPGPYSVFSEFYLDEGGTSGQYLIRARVNLAP